MTEFKSFKLVHLILGQTKEIRSARQKEEHEWYCDHHEGDKLSLRCKQQ